MLCSRHALSPGLRLDGAAGRVHAAAVSDDPIALFRAEHARAAGREEFDADRAALATADAAGRPSVRFVLVREVAADGFVFYTNYESQKGVELSENPYAALAWHWASTGVQIRADGGTRRIAAGRSDAYFASRPRGSQIGAWASPQSRPVAEADTLVRAVAEHSRRFPDGPVARPPFWGGYVLEPHRIEFWHNGEDRLHDRFLYVKDGDGWQRSRLAP